MRKIVTVTKNGSRPAFIIPKMIAQALRWQPGSQLVIVVDRGYLVATSIDHEIDRLHKQAADVITDAEAAPAP